MRSPKRRARVASTVEVGSFVAPRDGVTGVSARSTCDLPLWSGGWNPRRALFSPFAWAPALRRHAAPSWPDRSVQARALRRAPAAQLRPRRLLDEGSRRACDAAAAAGFDTAAVGSRSRARRIRACRPAAHVWQVPVRAKPGRQGRQAFTRLPRTTSPPPTSCLPTARAIARSST
jgi:hypothetical protein